MIFKRIWSISNRQHQKNKAKRFIPKPLRIRLLRNHRYMEKILNHIIPMFMFDESKYLRGIKELDIPEYYKQEATLIFRELVPYRNDSIRNFCKNAILPPMKGITPCFLKTELKFPCYVCKFRYSSFSKNLVKLNEDERKAAMMQLITPIEV